MWPRREGLNLRAMRAKKEDTKLGIWKLEQEQHYL